MLEVVGKVDGRHAAGTEFALDAVAAGEGSSESRVALGHRANMAVATRGREATAGCRAPVAQPASAISACSSTLSDSMSAAGEAIVSLPGRACRRSSTFSHAAMARPSRIR